MFTTIILIGFLSGSILFAQDHPKPTRVGLGLEIGHWLPSNLNDPDLTSLKEVKNNPYVGVQLLKPWRFGLTFRISGGLWNYSEDISTPEEKNVQIASILLDLKYALLPEVLVSPYVSYGAGWFLGCEKSGKKFFSNFDRASEVGLGINIGAGFNFNLSRRLKIDVEFRYHYVKFNHVLVFTDNYSGPKISLAGILLF